MTARRKRMTALQEEVCLARGELLDGEICQLATTLAGRGPLEKSPLLKPKGSGYVSPDTPLELESMASQDLDWRQLSGQGQRGSQSPKGFGHRQDPKPLALDVAGPLDEDRIAAKVNKRLLPSLFLLALACSLDRANLSFAALQLNHDLGFTKMEYGLGSGLFFIAYAFLQIPATLLCVRLGAVPFLSASLMLWGIVACLFASLRSPVQFFILRFLLGLAESGAYPGMWHLMHQFYNAEQLGVAYTCVALATSVSGVLGGPLAAALLSLDGIVGLRGWQVLFLAEGLPSVLLGVILFCSLPRSPAEASFLQPEERAFLTMHRGHHGEALGTPKVDPRDSEWRRRWGAGGYRAMSRGLTIPPVEAEEAGSLRGPSEVLGAPMHTQVSPWWGFAVDWRIWWLALVWGLSAAALDGIVFWAPMLINRIFKGGRGEQKEAPLPSGSPAVPGHSEAVEDAVRAAFASTLPYLVAAVCMLGIAWSSKRRKERHWHGGLPLLVGGLAFGVLATVMESHPAVAFAALVVAAGGVWGVHGPLLSWPAVFLQGSSAAPGFAMVKMFGAVGSFTGPFLIGALADKQGTYTGVVGTLAVFLLVAGALNLGFPGPGYRPVPNPPDSEVIESGRPESA